MPSLCWSAGRGYCLRMLRLKLRGSWHFHVDVFKQSATKVEFSPSTPKGTYENRGIAPLILNLRTRWRRVVNLMLRPLYPRERTCALIEQESVWVLKTIWTFWEDKSWFKSSAPVKLRSAFFWDFTRSRKIFSYRRFGARYGDHIRWTAWPLKVGQTCPETSVVNFHSTLSKIPKSADLKKQVSFPPPAFGPWIV